MFQADALILNAQGMEDGFSGVPAASITSIAAFKPGPIYRASQRAVLFQGAAVILDATRMSEVSSGKLAALTTSSAVFKSPRLQEEYRVRNKEVRSQEGAATLTADPMKEEFSGTPAAYPVRFAASEHSFRT